MTYIVKNKELNAYFCNTDLNENVFSYLDRVVKFKTFDTNRSVCDFFGQDFRQNLELIKIPFGISTETVKEIIKLRN